MITTYKDLKLFVKEDRKRYNYTFLNYLRSLILRQDRAHAIRLLYRLQRTEYYYNRRVEPFFCCVVFAI